MSGAASLVVGSVTAIQPRFGGGGIHSFGAGTRMMAIVRMVGRWRVEGEQGVACVEKRGGSRRSRRIFST